MASSMSKQEINQMHIRSLINLFLKKYIYNGVKLYQCYCAKKKKDKNH